MKDIWTHSHDKFLQMVLPNSKWIIVPSNDETNSNRELYVSFDSNGVREANRELPF